eukprot:2314539-Pleurochrysis_carterae.AAC.1
MHHGLLPRASAESAQWLQAAAQAISRNVPRAPSAAAAMRALNREREAVADIAASVKSISANQLYFIATEHNEGELMVGLAQALADASGKWTRVQRLRLCVSTALDAESGCRIGRSHGASHLDPTQL